MKVKIIENKLKEEPEVIIRCDHVDGRLKKLLTELKSNDDKLIFIKNFKEVLVDPSQIIYFESKADKVFAYTRNEVYETNKTFAQFENELSDDLFFYANKSTIINIDRIDSLAPIFGGRFEALMDNGSKINISRLYFKIIRDLLGV